MNFIDNLENELNNKGITVYKMCKEIGINPNTVSNYKNGTIPKIDIVEKIADYLNITTDKLILGKDKRELSEDEINLLHAYDQADNAIKISVKKLLDIKESNSIKQESKIS